MIEMDIRITLADANMICAGLGKLPLESALEVFGKIQRAATIAVEAAKPKPVEPQPE